MRSALSRFRIHRAARAINRGAVIAYPTEAVYGLGCDPRNEQAVQRIIALKNRDPDAGLILIAASIDQLHDYLAPIPDDRRREVLASWPGPVTWIWPATAGTPRWITGNHNSIAVRVTAYPPASRLCRAAGTALVSTSANKSGSNPARSARTVRRYFGTGVDYILTGPIGGLERPTKICDALTGKVLRDDGN